ncbi:MAG: hypothetical protein PHQ00_07735, partial [Phycisphaerae bacterium]|nr:hypothetical protein [Phycisphaerae bacterium]
KRNPRLGELEEIYQSSFNILPGFPDDCYNFDWMPEVFGKWLVEHKQTDIKCSKPFQNDDFREIVFVEQKGMCIRFKLSTIRLGVICKTDKNMDFSCYGKQYGEGEETLADFQLMGKLEKENWQAQYVTKIYGTEDCSTAGVIKAISKVKEEE